MQIDMHYYGTYVLARCAGLKEDIARAIATAAEYVDDSDKLRVQLTDGSWVDSEATAHHPGNTANLDPIDQRRTWIPFHFLPGNEGDTEDHRLICRMDSANAQAMVKHHLSHASKPHGVLLIGIAAHVYADTFAHYGFSGISSKVNHIKSGSIVCDVKSSEMQSSLRAMRDRFLANYITGALADFLAGLGHGSGASYPDQPYLRWQFKYDDGRESGWRDNPATFLMGAQKLYEMFVAFRRAVDGDYDAPEGPRDFEEIKETIATIFAIEGDANKRIRAWNHYVQAGNLYRNPNSSPIPPYDPSTYLNDLKALPGLDSAKAKQTLVYTFIEAANVHRNFILETLLPSQGIHVDKTFIAWITKGLK
jgi:hypothetical protein